MRTSEHIKLELCGNCLMMADNGECGELHDDEPEPLSLIDDGWIVVPTCGEDCSESFSWSRCDGCGGLPGTRHDAVMFQIITEPNTEKEPVMTNNNERMYGDMLYAINDALTDVASTIERTLGIEVTDEAINDATHAAFELLIQVNKDGAS